jgi:Holliday junction resolvasome RuvABC DNA-binding subunit
LVEGVLQGLRGSDSDTSLSSLTSLPSASNLSKSLGNISEGAVREEEGAGSEEAAALMEALTNMGFRDEHAKAAAAATVRH